MPFYHSRCSSLSKHTSAGRRLIPGLGLGCYPEQKYTTIYPHKHTSQAPQKCLAQFSSPRENVYSHRIPFDVHTIGKLTFFTNAPFPTSSERCRFLDHKLTADGCTDPFATNGALERARAWMSHISLPIRTSSGPKSSTISCARELFSCI